MYQVIVKNMVSREIREVAVKAKCAQDIYDAFMESECPDYQWIVIGVHTMYELESIHELSAVDQTIAYLDLTEE